MSITYPPELLPKASSDDEAEVLIEDGAGGWITVNPNQGNQPRTAYKDSAVVQSQKRH